MKPKIQLVEKNVSKKGDHIYDRYLCYCGNEFVAQRGNVKYGHTKSCGCKVVEMITGQNRTHGLINNNKRLYRIWKGMRQRCNNPTSFAYPYYGAKGVKICDAWEDYAKFYEWANSNGYSDSLTIDRIDPAGDYEATNCSWVTRAEQTRNRRDTIGWDSVEEIRRKYNIGESIVGMANEYDVTVSSIKSIIYNKSYFNPDFSRVKRRQGKQLQ